MKIIDFEMKGNSVRFILGNDDCHDYTGDDWDDAPYEHNAGHVYEEYQEGIMDVAFPFDFYVIEPKQDWQYRCNSPFCKDDFKARRAPCVVVVPTDVMSDSELRDGWHRDEYSYWCAADNVFKIYFGDSIDKIKQWEHAGECMITCTVG